VFFVNTNAGRRLETPRDDSVVAMEAGYGWNRRPVKDYYKLKKNHPVNQPELMASAYKNMAFSMVGVFGHVPDSRAYDVKKFSFTLKLTFEEGEDDILTEEEVSEFFTADEYAPVAIVLGHQTPSDVSKKTYVHFSCHEHAEKALEKAQGGASIGKATNVKVVFSDEKKWIRVRDGADLLGEFQKRSFWQKAYGDGKYYGWSTGELLPPTGWRRHPVYPEDDPTWKEHSYKNMKGTPYDPIHMPYRSFDVDKGKAVKDGGWYEKMYRGRR